MARYKTRKVNGTMIREHTLVWEAVHGPVPKGCVIHHINGDGKDNRLENLQLMTVGEHLALHAKMRREGTDPVDPNDPDVIEHRESLKKAGIKYRLKHKKDKAEYDRKYRELHSEEIKVKRAPYFLQHRAEFTAKQKERYYAKHDENLEKMRLYREANRELLRARNRYYHAVKTHKPNEMIERLKLEIDRIKNGK